MEQRDSIRAMGVLCLVTFFWGTTFTCLKFLLADWSLFFVLGARFTLAGLMVLPFCRKELRKDLGRTITAGGILAAFNSGAIITQTVGLRLTTASNASFITAFLVVLVPIAEGIFFRRRITWMAYALALAALAGEGFISFQKGFEAGINTGDIWVLACAVLYSGQVIAMDRAVRKISPLAALFWMFMGTGAVCLALAGPMETIAFSLSFHSLFWFIFLLLLGTFGGYGLQAWGQRRVSSAKAALIYSLEPVFATLFAMIFLPGEGLNGIGIIGAGMIMAALVLSSIRDMAARNHS